MLEPRFRWALPDPVTPAAGLVDAAVRLGLSGRLCALLAARGVTDEAGLARWLGRPDEALHDPRLLPDAGAFADRIATARARAERVLVFGDFDADGLTGLAILVRALRRLGLEVEPYVPSRLDEGHGLSPAAVDRAAGLGASLIVTVDCGTTSQREIAAARGRGIDVLVTDHHRVPPELPPAVAIVNPHRADSSYPDRRLSGSGVAFRLAELLLADEPDGAAFARSLADLAMIGTVADVAPVVGENRAIARLGLDLLRRAPRAGIAALLARAGVAPGRVDLETVGFAIAPRLNAAGRVGEAADAARLLLTDDEAEAAALAEALETANSNRRDLMKTSLAEARGLLVADGRPVGPVVAVRGPWPVGIIGLVAGRLADELGRPAIVATELGGVLRASCRSDSTFDLAAALEACADLFVRYGGHAGAAGFEIDADRWDAFIGRITSLAAALPPPDPRPSLRIDLVVASTGADYALYRELAGLAPCGPGNPDPLVAVHGLTVVRAREANGGHTQLTLRRERDVLDAIAFGWPELASLVAEGDRLDVVGRLASRAFGGFESLQIEVRDVAPAGWYPDVAALAAAGAADGATAPGWVVAGAPA